MRKHLLTFFGLRLGSKVLLLFFKQCFSFLFVCFFFVGFAERIYLIKTVKLWSSILLTLHKSINLSVLNSNKVAFVMHESQKVASKSFMIRNFIYHF